ncbi:MAG: hypothetical protein WAT67_04405 [Candidatus Contendobacter sp.]
MTALTLLVPGLRGAGLAGRAKAGFPTPVAPALEWLLARADRQPAPPASDAALFQHFGLAIPTDADLPVAAITRLADGGETGPGWWLRADPVSLRPDVHGVYLADARALALTASEAAALAAAFNQWFVDDGVCLEALQPNRWYLRLADDPQLRTRPLVEAMGRDINPLLPCGPGQGRWHRLLTETQMLFYSHPLNQAREQQGRPLINGLWLWGGGVGPVRVASPAGACYADDPLARGLAQLSGMVLHPAPEQAEAWRHASAGADSLVVLEPARYDPADDDPPTWTEHVTALERDWFAPCRRWLQTGQLPTLRLQPGDGWTYTVTPAARRRFWRRPQPLMAAAR